MRVRAVVLALIFGWSAPTIAAPAEGSISAWFQSLRTHDGKSCCDEADCHSYPVKGIDGRFWIFYRDEWVAVPDAAVSARMDNPTGKYIACVVPNRRPILVLCFFLWPGV
jgi:hypothetical protein